MNSQAKTGVSRAGVRKNPLVVPRDRDELIPTRKSLITLLKNWRDDGSWQEFFDTYWKLIYCFARKSELTDAEAQDVVQEVMISVAKRMPKFKYDPKIGSFKAYLFKLTRWRIVDQVRKRGAQVSLPSRRTDTSSDWSEVPEVDRASGGFEALWNKEWKENLLKAAEARVRFRMDPAKDTSFHSYVVREVPAEKVAEQFGVSVNQVYLAKNRISELIMEELKRLESERL